MKIAVLSGLEGVDAQAWDGLVRGGYPFLRHGFLCALERHGCVGGEAGWVPRHLGCFDDDSGGGRGRLVGAMPLYEKHNSWGEFVFDHAWADAFHRAGLAYYPKLVNAVPFTPASGQRILAAPGRREEITRALLAGARELMRRGRFSGLHSLFIADDEFDLLNTAGAVSRADCQFHWHNRDYADFAAFLATLKAKKRKNIRRERAKVADSGLVVRRLDGHTASDADWRDFDALYRGIYQRKYGQPAFNRAFFVEVAAAMPEQTCLVTARRGGGAGTAENEMVAAALLYHDHHTLYGRHWGCSEYIDCLHFEVCYYQGIEFCIERNLQRFDPGAQGEHKIARGFSPVRTRSLHWMAHNAFTRAIQQFAGREQSGVAHYIHAVEQHSPYHHHR